MSRQRFGMKPMIRFGCGLLLALLNSSTPVWAVEHTKPQGEPYALAGKRLVFTNWTFVRTGQLDWQNDAGESLYAKPVNSGPWDSHFHSFFAPHGIRLTTEPAQRPDKPFIEFDRPWETMGIGVSTLLFDQGKFRLWASCQDGDGVVHPCYFESTDGESWIKPNLGLVEFQGNRENNLMGIIGQDGKETDGRPLNRLVHFSVFRDPNPDVPAAERYKSARAGDADIEYFNSVYKKKYSYSIMALETDPGRVHAIIGAVSPDGLRWTDLKEPISVEPSDTHIVVDYNALNGRYLLYTRSYMVAPRAEGYPNPTERMRQFIARRAIGRGESADFRHFPPSEVIIESESDWAPTDTIYTNCKTTIPHAPDHHVMFPAIYHQADDTTSLLFYSSLDGRVWHRAPGGPVLKTANFGAFDGGCVFAYPNLVELPDGDWVLPYTGGIYPHKYPRGEWRNAPGLARWPKGRLAALEAPEKGEFWTVGFMPPGRTIRINAVTARAGSIIVEVCDFNGQPVAGRTMAEAKPVIGDQFRTTLAWGDHTDIGLAKGEPVILHFVMERAKIYALDFE